MWKWLPLLIVRNRKVQINNRNLKLILSADENYVNPRNIINDKVIPVVIHEFRLGTLCMLKHRCLCRAGLIESEIPSRSSKTIVNDITFFFNTFPKWDEMHDSYFFFTPFRLQHVSDFNQNEGLKWQKTTKDPNLHTFIIYLRNQV